MKIYAHGNLFPLESGTTLPGLAIAYDTWGTLNDTGDNVVWICHALTASSDAASWWPGLIGPGLLFDTDRYFIVCANIIGSCYGTTGPLSTDPPSERPWFGRFPLVSIRDMTGAHRLLATYLGIRRLHLLTGGSMGGYQALEWAVIDPAFVASLLLIATSARESAWGIAIHTAQRLAIEADQSWGDESPGAAARGLKAARAIGMLTYRSYDAYAATQTDPDSGKLDGFRASSYIHYQGDKLVSRFNAYSYHVLTRAMDTHNLARGRGRLQEVLRSITARTLVMGITSDLLCPLAEQALLAEQIPGARLVSFDSLYGHDGFLVETATITRHVDHWLSSPNKSQK
ncbi:MAG: metX [Flaviaesturariibacter sp.]|nr:metX [Flaviaesturariibacter sp.]